jgi:hypothetical protein
MNGWQVQEMWEADANAAWEALNAPDPAERQMKEAADSLDIALDNIDSGLDWISDAVSKLDELPMADKVQSFLDDFEKLSKALEDLKDHYERGERE